jgi:hypothetical protein
MATYIQGVTDFIPDYQPFQPDLNFYANLLQTKQTQYDTNWNQLNNLYGQLYGAELTHDQNIKKKDELLKQIDFNLKRVSGLDLSLEQNVNQAMQVFRPFYEDKYLIRDMAFTKNWKNTYSNAQALANSSDAKEQGKYWDMGLRGLEYRRQMFKDATLDETMYMQDPQYVPKVDVMTEYMDFAKKYDINMVTQTPEGLYLVKTKNGKQLLPALQQIFWAQYANRPDMQSFYKEKAFVERMDYASQNAEKFGGNKLEAEKEYIKDKYTWLQTISAQADGKAKDELNVAQNLKASVESNVAQGNVNLQQKSYLEKINELLEVNTQVEKYTSEVNAQLNSDIGTSTVPSNATDIFSNMELARLKVDAGYASYNAGIDIQNAAGSYAYTNYEVEYKPDAAAIAQFKEASANARLDKSHQYKMMENEASEKLARITEYQKAMVTAGRAYWKPDGSIEMNPQNSGYDLIIKGKGESGQTSGDKTQFDVFNQEVYDEVITKKTGPGINAMMTYINGLVNSPNGNQFTNQQLGQLLGRLYPNDPKVTPILRDIVDQGKKYPNQTKAKQIWNQLYNEYNSSSDKSSFVKGVTKFGDIYSVNEYMQQWAKNHTGSDVAAQYVNDESIKQLAVLGRDAEALEMTRANNAKKLQTAFTEKLNFQAEKLKSQGVSITDKQVNNAVQQVMNEYIASGYNWDAIKKNADKLDQLISGELSGMAFSKGQQTARDRSWWEYIPGIYSAEAAYDALTGNTEVVNASWIKDILDEDYAKLASDNTKKGLASFVPTVSRGIDPLTGDVNISLASDTQTVKVDVDYAGDFGYQATQQAIQDALALPMGDDTKFKFALSNNIPTNEDGEVDYANDGLDDDVARSILSTLYSRLGDSKIGDFTLSSSRVALENSKLGSTTFNVPRTIVEEVVKSMKGSEFTTQQLAQYTDNIVQNGITVIAPHEYFSHKLFATSQPTATEVILNNKDITFEHPNKAGTYVLKKVEGVPGVDYGAYITTNILDKDGNVVTKEGFMRMDKTSGRTIEQIEATAWQLIAEQDKRNQDLFKAFHQNNDQASMTKALDFFSTGPNNAFWK